MEINQNNNNALKPSNTSQKKLTNKQKIKVAILSLLALFVFSKLLTNGTSPVADNSMIEQPGQDNATATDKKTDSFHADFDRLCSKLTTAYDKIGTVDCQDITTWSKNNELNPNEFPYEYRDINVIFSNDIAYEIKVIKDSAHVDALKKDYTCDVIFSGNGSCIVGEAKNNILFSVIFYDVKDQEEINKLADGLRTILGQ